MGADVTDFRFRGNEATVRADHNRVQNVIDHFKEWLPRATDVYRRRVLRQRQQDEQQERDRLQQMRAEQERRLALRQNIRL